VVASAASIVFAPVVAVIVMGAVVVANVPYAAYKEFRIVKLPGMCSYTLSYDVFLLYVFISHHFLILPIPSISIKKIK